MQKGSRGQGRGIAMASDVSADANSYDGYETAEQSLAARSKDIRTVSQVIRGGGKPPASELEKFVGMIDDFKELMKANPKMRTLRAFKNLVVIAKHIDDQRRQDYETDHKMKVDRASIDLQAERNDLSKVNLALRAHAARVPVNIFGNQVGAVGDASAALGDDSEAEFDRMIAACQSPEEFEALERIASRMPD